MDRKNIDKIAKNPEDRLLLAKLWDKISLGMRKNIPAFTGFLSPREQEMARFLFGQEEGLVFWGGYDDAERKILAYLPDYLDSDYLKEEDAPVSCIRAAFYPGEHPTHRDFLGALMGAGIARETTGDILISDGCCDFFVISDMTDYILQNFLSAGRTKIHTEKIPLDCVAVPEPEIREIHDTVASLRLDSIISSGFRMGRNAAADAIHAGRVTIDGLPCEKSDKSVCQGVKIALRGQGKIYLANVNGETKKGRISVTIHRYL